MRMAALDISKNRVGIAISDEDCIFISFSSTLFTKNYQDFKRKLKMIFIEYKPLITYVGLPLINNNILSENTKFVKIFTHNIREIIGKFEFVDEKLSTFHAKYMIDEKFIPKQNVIDGIVAREILLEQMHKQN